MSNKRKQSDFDLLVISPDDAALAKLRESWTWLLEEPWQPVLFTAFGDMFFKGREGQIFWLCTGDGSVTQVADSVEHFETLLETDEADFWLLPDLVQSLIAEGKVLGPQQCYAFTIAPIFAEYTYTPDNLNPISVQEHFAWSGELQRRISGMEDGSKIQIEIAD